MSYCFNPACQNPQNPADAEICSSCGSQLLLTHNLSLSEIKSETALKELETPLECRYRAIKPIGQGGFGRTFLAVDENKPFTYSQCVIKQFFPQNPTEKAAEWFHREAMQLETLGKHPQIPNLIAHFEQDKQQYLVQEFIAGKNLAQELAQKGPFNELQIRQLLQDLLPVLHFVHKSKVIHRDIKPENIIRRTNIYQGGSTGFIPLLPTDLISSQSLVSPGIARNGQLVLVDFGAAKKVKGNGLPQTGTIVGSAAYTAPEQLMGKAVFASDIYSLGITCIHLLTQVPPFDLFDSREGTWAWRDYLKTPVSDNLGHILDKMLQGATNHRYHAAAAVIRHLNPKPVYVETLPVTSEPAIVSPEMPTEPPPLPPDLPPPPNQKLQGKIQQALQDTLTPYNVKIQVNKTKRKLTVVINRNEDCKIHYPHLSQIIATTLTDLQLNQISVVKLLGRVNNSPKPEWKQVLQIDTKIQFRNKIIRLQNNKLAGRFSQLKTREFWLSKFKSKDFWIDLLMFALMLFILGTQIIILKPWVGIIISSVFLYVKTQVAKNEQFKTNSLLATLAGIFLIMGIGGNYSIFVSGPFGILLGCLFMALPLFYTTK